MSFKASFALLPWLVCLLAAIPVSAGASSTTTIELRPVAEVRPGPVRLGDIAYLHGPDLAMLRELIALPLGNAPQANRAITLERHNLAAWVSSRRPMAKAAYQLQWTGTERTTVQVPIQRLPGTRLAEAARAPLLAWLRQFGERTSAELISDLQSLPLPVGRIEIRPRPLPPTLPLSRRIAVWLDIYCDNRFARALPVRFEISAWQAVPVAARDLPSGMPLSSGAAQPALVTHDVDVTLLGVHPLSQKELTAAIQDAAPQLRHALRKGQPLTSQALETAPAVARGQWITVEARSGVIDLQLRAEALQDARPGQTVRLKTSQGTAPLLARVIGPGKVEILQ